MGDGDVVLSVTVADHDDHDRWRVVVEVVLPSQTAAEAAAAVLGALSEIQ